MVSTTMASVTELAGRAREPETYKLVVLALVAKRFVVVTIVPEAEVKPSGPESDPPVKSR